jgi:trk system potassium uptake protein TrkH
MNNASYQLIASTIGLLTLLLGSMMLIPAAIDWNDDHNNALVFLHSAAASWFIGGILYFTNRGLRAPINTRQAFLLTSSAWIFTSFITAIPFWLSDLNLSFTNALFEAISGITTTGMTIIDNLEQSSRGIIVWRSMIQMLGGLGIIAFVMLLMPILKVGGMQLLQTESSDGHEKSLPRAKSVMHALLRAYLILCALCAITYYTLGMSGFDAINYAMTTLSTGGFGVHDGSFSQFSPAIQWAAIPFMIAGAIPFIMYARMLVAGEWIIFRDLQVRALIFLICVSTTIVALNIFVTQGRLDMDMVRHSLFKITSVLTTTGFVSDEYMPWSSFAVILFIFLSYIGACAGSTSGGMKLLRVIVAVKALSLQFKRLIYPNGSFVLTYDGNSVPAKTVFSVLGFLFLYVATNTVLTIALTATGLDLMTALSAAASSIANGGMIYGRWEPLDSLSDMPDIAKMMLCVGMIMGRLEIMSLLVIFTADFWKK